MKKVFSGVVAAALLCIAGWAFAGSDDAKWVAECIRDNKDETVSIEVITKYCTCMNRKMDVKETLSISQWEEIHPAERAACDHESGWK